MTSAAASKATMLRRNGALYASAPRRNIPVRWVDSGTPLSCTLSYPYEGGVIMHERYEHTLLWHCPTCGRTERSRTVASSRNLEVDQKVCTGMLISHGAREMYWTDHSVRPIFSGKVASHSYAQGGFIPTPPNTKETNMANNFHQSGALGGLVTDTSFLSQIGGLVADTSFLSQIAELHTPKPNPAVMKAKEQAEIVKKIIVGDVIQLVAKAGSVIQGEVLAMKRQRGRVGPPISVRIKGFDHVGGAAGGHHVYWTLAEFDVEILVEAYRITQEDKLIALLGGFSDEAWGRLTEQQRTNYRSSYRCKADRVTELLKGGGG
jgi:hypothetical protein